MLRCCRTSGRPVGGSFLLLLCSYGCRFLHMADQLPVMPRHGGETRGLRIRPPARLRGLDPIAHDCHPLDDPLTDKVVHYIVLGEAVVPHADGAGGPVVTDGERRLLYPIGPIGEQMVAFLTAHL